MNTQDRITELKKRFFYLSMKDHWNTEDFKKADELRTEIRRLEKELNKWAESAGASRRILLTGRFNDLNRESLNPPSALAI